ncbi:MAG: PD40 domain-containing protein [Sedimentisphaerales bacterium]|nr:PD40 domain-containing protein [Sedimentisphaerales bacterium]
MKGKRVTIVVLVLALAASVCAVLGYRTSPREAITQFEQTDRVARIRPDYSGAVIPPNIAPLNFSIQEPGALFCVRISSAQGDPIEIFSRDPAISIPPGPWHAMLHRNRGQEVRFDVFVKHQDSRWRRFQPIANVIAPEDIDGYLVYRKMHPTHLQVRGEISIHARDLSTFGKTSLLSGHSLGASTCVNCHSFAQNRPDWLLLGVRSPDFGVGTLLVSGDTTTRIGAKFGYTSWHPSGRMAVYSVNDLPMFYHAARNEPRDTVNVDSLLACYLTETQSIVVEPRLAQKDRLENWPTWSGDGKHLYFCSAPKLWSDQRLHPPERFDQVRYDLMRIAYDVDSQTWGEMETVVSSRDTGKSIAMPRCSPDGRWVSFCLFDYGYFPTWHVESDLYMVDLREYDRTGQAVCRRLEINSDQSESWHTWSSNSRWLVFSSKRLHSVFTRLWLSYVDASGTVHKPIVLPQKDPAYYESCIFSFNTPELVTGLPRVTGENLARVFRSRRELSVKMPITMATPSAEGTAPGSSWQSRRE